MYKYICDCESVHNAIIDTLRCPDACSSDTGKGGEYKSMPAPKNKRGNESVALFIYEFEQVIVKHEIKYRK